MKPPAWILLTLGLTAFGAVAGRVDRLEAMPLIPQCACTLNTRMRVVSSSCSQTVNYGWTTTCTGGATCSLISTVFLGGACTTGPQPGIWRLWVTGGSLVATNIPDLSSICGIGPCPSATVSSGSGWSCFPTTTQTVWSHLGATSGPPAVEIAKEVWDCVK